MFPVLSANTPAAGAYNLTNSLRFRASASAFLSRTPASASNRKTWTWSAWLKRGTLTSTDALFNCNGAVTNTTYFLIRFESSGALYIGNASTNFCITNQVFRDPSAWYHLVITLDTTQATATNRLRIYVNGVEVTSFSSDNRAAQIAQNSDQGINQASPHNIGRENSGVFYLDGYLDEINFIDGQSLTPSSFGSFNSTTGVWQPARYTGTYGTNGFYLNFTNIALTSGSNTGLGQDFSGNGNFWNTNNISVTSGINYDAMTDVPTLTSATQSNYAVLNPVLQNGWWAAPNRGTISNGNLTHVSGGNTTAFGNFDFVSNSGKWYYEVTCGATDSNNTIVIAAQSRSTFEVGYYQSGQRQINGATPTGYGSSWTNGDIIGVAIDVPNNSITFYKNNVSQGAITNTFPTGQPVYGGSYYNTSSGDYNYNFGQRPFAYTPPTGFLAMNTFNLPTSTIVKGNSVMDATLYTGNGGTQTITNAGGFRPDLVWQKSRSSGTAWHNWIDVVRGVGNRLFSNSTDAESFAANSLTSFNSNGFSIGSATDWNTNGSSNVAWQWQAGSSTVTNTSGSISSQVRANTTAGFSIATFTAPSTNQSFTVGHGLGVAPRMTIVKRRDSSFGASWWVWHIGLGDNTSSYLVLNSTNAAATEPSMWGTVGRTSTVCGFNAPASIITNGTYVLYSFAEIAGFSRFGSYVANASSDGPFIYTGFRPRWIMFKRTTSATNWYVIDTSISPINASTAGLYPNTSAGDSTEGAVDILSNGFKCRVSSGAFNFPSGETFAYVAFAENPFKNALAR